MAAAASYRLIFREYSQISFDPVRAATGYRHSIPIFFISIAAATSYRPIFLEYTPKQFDLVRAATSYSQDFESIVKIFFIQ